MADSKAAVSAFKVFEHCRHSRELYMPIKQMEEAPEQEQQQLKLTKAVTDIPKLPQLPSESDSQKDTTSKFGIKRTPKNNHESMALKFISEKSAAGDNVS